MSISYSGNGNGKSLVMAYTTQNCTDQIFIDDLIKNSRICLKKLCNCCYITGVIT